MPRNELSLRLQRASILSLAATSAASLFLATCCVRRFISPFHFPAVPFAPALRAALRRRAEVVAAGQALAQRPAPLSQSAFSPPEPPPSRRRACHEHREPGRESD